MNKGKLLVKTKNKLTEAEYFSSVKFKNLLVSAYKFLTRSEKKVKINLYGKDDGSTAATNGTVLILNWLNPIAQKFPTLKLKIMSVLGMFYHEIGHLLYTDFDTTNKFVQEIENNGKITSPCTNLSAKKDVEEFLEKRPAFKKFVSETIFSILNSIEDIWMESKICEEFPGTVKKSIILNRVKISESMPILKKQIDSGNMNSAIIDNLILSYVSEGNIPNPHGLQTVHTEILNKAIPFLNQGTSADNQWLRISAAVDSFLLMWNLIKSEIDLREQQMRDAMQNSQNNPQEGESNEDGTNGGAIGENSNMSQNDKSYEPSELDKALAEEMLEEQQEQVQKSSNKNEDAKNSEHYRGKKSDKDAAQQQQRPQKQSSKQKNSKKNSNSQKSESQFTNAGDDSDKDSSETESNESSKTESSDVGDNSEENGSESFSGDTEETEADESEETANGSSESIEDADSEESEENEGKSTSEGSSDEDEESEDDSSGDGSDKDESDCSSEDEEFCGSSSGSAGNDFDEDGDIENDYTDDFEYDEEYDDENYGSEYDDENYGSEYDSEDDNESEDTSSGYNSSDADDEASSDSEEFSSDMADMELPESLKDFRDTIQQFIDELQCFAREDGEAEAAEGDGERTYEDIVGNTFDGIGEKIRNSLDEVVEEKVNKELMTESEWELQKEVNDTRFNNIHKNVGFIVNRHTEVHQADMDEYNSMNEVLKYSKALQSALENVLKNRNSGIFRKQFLGRGLDKNGLYDKQNRIFMKKNIPHESDLAVSILIDQSGSMMGSRIIEATRTAVILQDFCHAFNIPVSIAGHYWDGYRVVYDVYTDFDDIDGKDKFRLMQIYTAGCNRDGAALQFCGEHLLKRPEEKKLLILISDGQPNADTYRGDKAKSDLQQIQKYLRNREVELFAAAIGSDRDVIKGIYRDNYLDISDLKSLPKTMVRLVENFMEI